MDRGSKRALSIGSLAVLALLSVGPCAAATPIQAVLACRRVTPAGARLSCFDRAAARLASAHAAANTRTAAAPAPPAPPAPPAVKSLSSQQAFGLSDSTLNAHEVAIGALPKPISHISAKIRHIGTAANGRWIFTLSNGQVWAQVYANHDLLVSRGQRVSISRQLFDSYWLQLPNDSGCKVERIR